MKVIQLTLLLFCVWKFIHFYCYKDFVIGNYHNIFIHSSAGEYLCFQFSIITNNAIMCLLTHAVCLSVFMLVFLHVYDRK